MKDEERLIRPEILYTHGELAARIGKSADWVKRHLILTNKLQYTPVGETYMILGEWFIRYCIENSVFKSEAPSKRRPKKNQNGGPSV